MNWKRIKIHPKINRHPPIGVMGPNQLRLKSICDWNDNNKILKEKSSVPIIKKNEISFLPSTDKTDNINSARPWNIIYLRLKSMDSDAVSGSIFLKLWLFNAPKMIDNKANVAPNNFAIFTCQNYIKRI